MNGGSVSILYGKPLDGKNGTEGTIDVSRGFDGGQMQTVGVQGDDGGHGRKGFWSNLCCGT